MAAYLLRHKGLRKGREFHSEKTFSVHSEKASPSWRSDRRAMTLLRMHTATRALRYVLVLFYTGRMGFLANGTWVIDTLGDLIEQGSNLSAYCGNRPDCGRALDLDVYDLAIQFGRRWKHVERKPPVRCSRCGSRDLHWIMSPDTLPLERARESEPSNFRQQFDRIGKRIVAGRQMEQPSAQAAAARAERDASRCAGVVAIQQTVDTETGEVLEEPIVLAKFGELPAGMAGAD